MTAAKDAAIVTRVTKKGVPKGAWDVDDGRYRHRWIISTTVELGRTPRIELARESKTMARHGHVRTVAGR